MIAEIHVAPSPLGDEQSHYKHVKAALSIIAKSGLKYEVGAMGTTVQGAEEKVWETLRLAHEATILSGADKNFTNIRIFSTATDEPDMSELTADYR